MVFKGCLFQQPLRVFQQHPQFFRSKQSQGTEQLDNLHDAQQCSMHHGIPWVAWDSLGRLG